MPAKRTRRGADRDEIPNIHQETWLRLENITDHAAFQSLCDTVLSQKWEYKVHPRGVSVRGTVKGRPDSWGTDKDGKAVAFCYGTDLDWRRKLKKDLKDLKKDVDLRPEHSPEVVVFCTNRHIDATVEQEVVREIRTQYDWELRLFGQGELATALDTDLQHIRARYLNIKVERHTWQSLLAACADQRERILLRYMGKYDPTLYVPRRAESVVDAWYRSAIDATAKGRSAAQLLPLVDQAGAGKSTLVLHLAEVYAARGPVLVLPGSLKLTDDHGFEREIVDAVGFPQDQRTYHGDLDALCELAQRAGYPLLIVIDAVDEGRDLALARAALIQLLTAYHDRPLLILMTCRDTVWTHVSDPVLRRFVPPSVRATKDSLDFGTPLGPYDDEEYRAAQERYFLRSDVTAHLSGAAAHMLRLPLLLRIFTEVFRDRNLGHIRSLASSDLWREYAERKVADVHEALNRSLRPSAITNVLEQIAQRMLERSTPVLDGADLAGIPHLDPDNQSAESLLLQLQNAGLVLEDPPETIRLVHEQFAEFILGRILAGQLDRADQFDEALRLAEQLIQGDRWRYVVVHAATLAMDPSPLLSHLRGINLWWAARALIAVGKTAPAGMRSEIIRDLVDQLGSRYALDRRRAADALGRLMASECTDQLRAYWSRSQDTAALRALARLGVEDIAEEFVLYLGRDQHFLWPELQELVDSLPNTFKGSAVRVGIQLLSTQNHANKAATALGYLRDEQAINPLMNYLEAVGWADPVALIALLRIGTPEALTELARAIGEAGESVSRARDAKHNNGDPKGASNGQVDSDVSQSSAYWALENLRVRGLQHSDPQRVTPLLARLLQHPNFYVRYEAIMALMVLKAADVAPVLVASASLAADEWGTQFELKQAIEAFGRQLDAEPFLELANDSATPDAVMRLVVAALGASGDRRALPVLRGFVSERRFLIPAIDALGALGHPEAVEILAPLLETTDTGTDSAESVHLMTVVALGRLQHPAAFAPLERRYREQPSPIELEALVAAGRELAIPMLREAWQASSTDNSVREQILQSLIWIDTPTATAVARDLLQPLNGESVSLFVHALFSGRGLPFITGTITKGSVDDGIVELVDEWFDRIDLEAQQTAIWALGAVGTSRAIAVLMRIAEDLRYDIPMPCAKPGESRTMHNEALRLLAEAGSIAALDFSVDHVGEPGAILLEESLSRMDRQAVLDALCRRLDTSPEAKLVRLLELLGWLGGHTVVDDVRRYVNDSRQSVADAAYEAEQRILELAEY